MRNIITLSKSFLIFIFLSSIALHNISIAQPVLEWSATYAWVGNSRDIPVEMVLSDSSYIYIGGQCTEDGIANYLTLKYDNESNLLWDRVHSGAGTDHHKLRAIALDRWGNAIVTGFHHDTYNNHNIYTIKYSSFNGYTIWANEVVPLWIPNGDEGWDVAVDSSGNAYVTGWVFSGTHPNGTGNDWMTVAYQPLGVELWKSQHNGTDSTGDRSFSIEVTPGGIAYYAGETSIEGVNGYSLRIVKKNVYGANWVRVYHINADSDLLFTVFLKITENEDVYVTAHTGSNDEKNVYLIKHDSSGYHEWTRTYNGPDNLEDYPVDLEVDNEGNVIVLCLSREINNLESMATLKYSSEGDTLWIKRHQYQYGNVEPKALTIDSDNNVYVLGEEGGFYIVKYDSDGDEQWVEENFDADYAVDIALDVQNNIYVTGTEDFDIVTVKYSQVTGVSEPEPFNSPKEFNIFQNYPNPFNPTTTIKYQIAEINFVTIKIYDVLGNEVSTLINEEKPAGKYEVEFNVVGLTSGVYFYQLKAGSFVETKKMVLLK
jgi:hypothetical protein